VIVYYAQAGLHVLSTVNHQPSTIIYVNVLLGVLHEKKKKSKLLLETRQGQNVEGNVGKGKKWRESERK
jgi:hypothetical protein